VPVLNPIGPQSVDENDTKTFTISGSDAEGDPLTYSATNLPAGATFDDATRTFTWTPTSAQVGTHDVTFRLFDGTDTVEEVVTFTVNQVTTDNVTPVFDVIGTQTMKAGEVLNLELHATDPDPTIDPATGMIVYGEVLTYALVGGLEGISNQGFVQMTSSGKLKLKANPVDAGTYNVQFSVTDIDGNVANQTVQIIIDPLGVMVPEPAQVFYTDVQKGPNTGGEDGNGDGNGDGVYVSIFGKGFGFAQGNSKVFVGGTEVAVYHGWGHSEYGTDGMQNQSNRCQSLSSQ